MRSKMIEEASYIPEADKPNYTDLQVLYSPAGWYVGTYYNNPEGFVEPGSRDSVYFEIKDQAEYLLDILELVGYNHPSTSPYMRKHP